MKRILGFVRATILAATALCASHSASISAPYYQPFASQSLVPCNSDATCKALQNIAVGGVTFGGNTGTAFYTWDATDACTPNGGFYFQPSGATHCFNMAPGGFAANAPGIPAALNSGQILVGNASNVAAPASMSGDAAISNTGALTLANSGATAGTYSPGSVTVDAKGRITGVNSTLPSGHIFVGNGSNVSASVAISGDAVLTNTGTLTVSTLNGIAPGTVFPKNLGTSVNDPGTGALESLLPVKTNTYGGYPGTPCTTSCTFTGADLQYKIRRSNAGSVMTDQLPPSTAPGLTNGSRIDIANVDSTVSDTLTAGSGTTISSDCAVLTAGRDELFVYDYSNATWRGDANTCTGIVAPPAAPNTTYYVPIPTIAALEALGSRSSLFAHASVASYTSGGVGGGKFDWSPTSTATADNCVVFIASGLSTGRWIRTSGNAKITPFDCGAAGDGTTNDTAALESALNAVASGGEVYIPAGTFVSGSSLAIGKPLLLDGPGTINSSVSGQVLLNITASNVIIKDISLTGVQSSTYVGTDFAISAGYPTNTNAAPTWINNLKIEHINVTGFGAYGVFLQYVDGFVIGHNQIGNLGYTGIGGASVKHGAIVANAIFNINGTGAPNDYGIYISRLTSDVGELTSQPLSSQVQILGNSVDGVPAWEGIDTHGGQYITVTGNTLHNTLYGIAAVSSKNSSGTVAYAPTYINITGNVLDSGVTNGSHEAGIELVGSSTQNATGSIVGNFVTNYGDQSLTSSGGIIFTEAQGCTINSNTISYAGSNGIYSGGAINSCSLQNNMIIDPWSNTNAAVNGIDFAGSPNVGIVVAANSVKHIDKTATYLITSSSGVGFRFSATAGNTTFFVPGESDATILFTGSSTLLSTLQPLSTVANGSVATALSSIGPTGAHTTVQEWFAIPDLNGTIRYVPGF